MEQPRRRIPNELPPPAIQPLPPASAAIRALGRRRARLLQRDAGGEAVLAVMPTRTSVDTGSWFGRRRVTLAFTPTALLLFAPGPRPLCRRIPLAELRRVQYNTVTGELVLTHPEAPAPALALAPVAAAQALAQLAVGDLGKS